MAEIDGDLRNRQLRHVEQLAAMNVMTVFRLKYQACRLPVKKMAVKYHYYRRR